MSIEETKRFIGLMNEAPEPTVQQFSDDRGDGYEVFLLHPTDEWLKFGIGWLGEFSEAKHMKAVYACRRAWASNVAHA